MCRLLPQAYATALLAAMHLASAASAAAAVEEPIELADDPFQITDPVAAKPGTAEVAFIGAYEREMSRLMLRKGKRRCPP